MQELIHLLHLRGKPFFISIKSIKCQFILSKAFPISSLITNPLTFFNFSEINGFICNQYGISDLPTSNKSHLVFGNGIGESLFKPIYKNFCQKLVECSSQTDRSIIRHNGVFIFFGNKSYVSGIHNFIDDTIFMKFIENIANISF